MAATKKAKDDSPDLPPQSEEARQATLNHAVRGQNTATGQAIEHLSGAEDERIGELEAEGSTQEIAGGDGITADFAEFMPAEPVGLQAEMATYAVNGTINPATVPSPGGPVPVGAVAASVADARARTEQTLAAYEQQVQSTNAGRELTEEQINNMSAAELRAVAFDRGYTDVGYFGTHRTRQAFLKAQQEDEALEPAEA